jgi:hypothetical protein
MSLKQICFMMTVFFSIMATQSYLYGPKLKSSGGKCGTIVGHNKCFGMEIGFNILTQMPERRCFGISFNSRKKFKLISY